jgi:dihydrofolate synthase/folylpolyglutamate synthase
MKYADILKHIFTAYPMYHKVGISAYKEGLENIEALAAVTGHPEKKIRSVHVAGTNGKGSTAHFLASWFQELGYKTGLYTSPHLVDFRERIRINGVMISEEEVIHFFERFQGQFSQFEPSFFEMTTMLAFDHFARQQVDIAIIEVGLGGRLDATNILIPELSVITNISLDHTQLLGQTIAQIAAEKGGIIKPNVPVVIGEKHPESQSVFQALACEHGAAIFFADANFEARKRKGITDEGMKEQRDERIDIYKNNILLYSNIKPSLQANYQLKNIATFMQAVEVLTPVFNSQRREVTVTAIENILKNTHLLGRWQQLSANPLTICDVGHNAGGLTLTMQQLLTIPCRKLHFIIGFVNDKDITNIINLLPREAHYYLCCAAIERALPLPQLAGHFAAAALSHTTCLGVAAALKAAQIAAQTDDLIFIGGSCFVVGEVLKPNSNT